MLNIIDFQCLQSYTISDHMVHTVYVSDTSNVQSTWVLEYVDHTKRFEPNMYFHIRCKLLCCSDCLTLTITIPYTHKNTCRCIWMH